MRLVDNELRCYECRKVSLTEEVEIIERDGKKYWICPHCDMETPIVDRVFPPEGASDFKKGLRKA